MLFRSATAFIAVVAFAQTAFAGLTPAQVVSNIQIVTTMSSNANSALVPLPAVPTPSQAQTIAQNLANSFNSIISSLGGDDTAMDATQPFGDADATPVINALNEFITIHQELLGTVIGKHTIFAQFGLTAPIAAVLRGLEAGVDAFAHSMINLIPTKATEVTTGSSQLGQTVSTSITVYEQLCIPSPLYPTIPTICVAV